MAGAGAAQAAGPDATTSDQVGAVNGNQVIAPIQAPINICGVAAAVLGSADAGCEGGASAENSGSGADLHSHDNTGLGNGNQVYAPVQVPTEVSGIAAAVGGTADAWSTGGSEATIEEAGGGSDLVSKRNTGLLSGNQLLAPIQAPVNVCGNAVAVAGTAAADCVGGASASYEESDVSLTSEDNTGLGNGNQVYAPIQAPVNVCGNAVAILGIATASCEGGSEADHGDDEGHKKHDGYTESSTTVVEEQLPTGGVPGLDTVTGAAGSLTGGLPVVGDVTGGNASSEGVAAAATDTVSGATELAGAGLL